MEFFSTCAGIPVHVNDTQIGQPALVLLHGYLETLEVWDDFADRLKRHFRIVRIDLPGHGLSGSHAKINSPAFSAQVVREVLQKCGIAQCTLIGHSMGGYVSLAFADNYPEVTQGLCLFHSTPNADTPQKQDDLSREIALIRAGKLPLVVRQSIPRMFAEENRKRCVHKIEELEEVADVHEPEGIIACLEGMKQRPDYNDFLAAFRKPLLLIFGENDPYISLETARLLSARFPQAQTLWLKHTGHIGFVEEAEAAAEAIIRQFSAV
jgi:pimeloyl-ACP methyl ester carboxylesterase